MDVQAYFNEDCTSKEIFLLPGERRLIPTGIKVGIPEGMMIQICSRSGLAAKNGVISLISPGIIDSGYRGELKVCLYNSGVEGFKISHGDRIAQLILQFTPKLPIQQVTSEDHLGESDRGVGGFGSTGVQ
jgi:dUTP pyrophosphatase